MKKGYLVVSSMLGLMLVIALVGCGLTPAEQEAAVATVQSLPPSELAGLSATVQALPAEQVEAAETAAAAAGVPTLDANQVTAVVGTVVAARATATVVGQQVAAGERINATQAPQDAPRIIYFFASAASKDSMQNGVRYHLNWTTQNADRVEIFGNVMDNPVEGSWPVYNDSNDWTLWAANDQVWVEQFLKVEGDKDVSGSLSDVTVDSLNITLSLRDPQFVDGDVVNIDVNGVRAIDRYVLGGRPASFPITLNSGANTVTVIAQNEGITPPFVGEITISNTTNGQAVQLTPALARDASASFTITAP